MTQLFTLFTWLCFLEHNPVGLYFCAMFLSAPDPVGFLLRLNYLLFRVFTHHSHFLSTLIGISVHMISQSGGIKNLRNYVAED